MSRNDRRDLTPATPSSEGRDIVAHIGKQTIRIPTLLLLEHGRRSLEDLEAWKARASGKDLAMYAALKAALNLLIPILREMLKGGESVTGIPAMPKRERHTDPVSYLLGYCHAFLPHVLSKGEFTLDVDEDGQMQSLDWSYLDQLRAVQEAERLTRNPPMIEAETEAAPAPNELSEEGDS